MMPLRRLFLAAFRFVVDFTRRPTFPSEPESSSPPRLSDTSTEIGARADSPENSLFSPFGLFRVELRGRFRLYRLYWHTADRLNNPSRL